MSAAMNVMRAPRRFCGVTLLELTVVIAIMAIVASVGAAFIVRPVEGYVDLARRAMLVDVAESAVRRMAREIRSALPNSVRITNAVGGGFALEFIPIVDAGKYTTSGAASVKINLHGNFDADFDNLGCLHVIAPGTYTHYRIVINNLGTPGYDVYTTTGTTGVVTPLTVGGAPFAITITDNPGASCSPVPALGDQHVHFSVNHAFLDSSPHNRFFVIEKPVTFLCDPASGVLTRYADYPIQATQPTTAAALDALPGVTSGRVADRVRACTVRVTAEDVRNRGLVSLDVSLAEAHESVRLIHQAQLDNSR